MPSFPRPRRARVHPVPPRNVTARPFPSRADLPLVERYLALRATRLGERTVITYRRELTVFTIGVGGDAAVLAMTPEALALWFRARLREPGRPDDCRR